MLRVPLRSGSAWFKACSAVQAFEPRLSAKLYLRWPDFGEILAYDEERAWLLLADAGVALREFANPPGAWLDALPLYAELQHGEAVYADEHVAHGAPSLPISTLPARYSELLNRGRPLEPDELARLAAFWPLFGQLCAELDAAGLPLTVQQDDLHMGSVYARDLRLRVLDWGDITAPRRLLGALGRWAGGPIRARPPCRQVRSRNRWARQREFLPPAEQTPFDAWFAHVLRPALRMK